MTPKRSYWKKAAEPIEQVKRALPPFFAFVGRGEDDPPERPTRFWVEDEHGNKREVYAPRGRVTRWPW